MRCEDTTLAFPKLGGILAAEPHFRRLHGGKAPRIHSTSDYIRVPGDGHIAWQENRSQRKQFSSPAHPRASRGCALSKLTGRRGVVDACELRALKNSEGRRASGRDFSRFCVPWLELSGITPVFCFFRQFSTPAQNAHPPCRTSNKAQTNHQVEYSRGDDSVTEDLIAHAATSFCSTYRAFRFSLPVFCFASPACRSPSPAFRSLFPVFYFVSLAFRFLLSMLLPLSAISQSWMQLHQNRRSFLRNGKCKTPQPGAFNPPGAQTVSHNRSGHEHLPQIDLSRVPAAQRP